MTNDVYPENNVAWVVGWESDDCFHLNIEGVFTDKAEAEAFRTAKDQKLLVYVMEEFPLNPKATT